MFTANSWTLRASCHTRSTLHLLLTLPSWSGVFCWFGLPRIVCHCCCHLSWTRVACTSCWSACVSIFLNFLTTCARHGIGLLNNRIAWGVAFRLAFWPSFLHETILMCFSSFFKNDLLGFTVPCTSFWTRIFFTVLTWCGFSTLRNRSIFFNYFRPPFRSPRFINDWFFLMRENFSSSATGYSFFFRWRHFIFVHFDV